MFGQQSKPFGSPFGQPQQQSTFGKPAGAFGQPTFGQQAQPLFGSSQPSTVFGQTAPAFGGTPAPSFGQPATTQSTFGSKYTRK